jgi:hypothetical protein
MIFSKAGNLKKFWLGGNFIFLIFHVGQNKFACQKSGPLVRSLRIVNEKRKKERKREKIIVFVVATTFPNHVCNATHVVHALRSDQKYTS